MMDELDIVTQSAAARILGRDRRNINNWIARGHVKGHKIDGQTRVSIEECRAWIDSPKTRVRS